MRPVQSSCRRCHHRSPALSGQSPVSQGLQPVSWSCCRQPSRLSITISVPSLTFDDSAILRPIARIFLFSDGLKSRTRAPWALPPPINVGANGDCRDERCRRPSGCRTSCRCGQRQRTLAGAACGRAPLFKLPGDDPVENVGARFKAEHVVIQIQCHPCHPCRQGFEPSVSCSAVLLVGIGS